MSCEYAWRRALINIFCVQLQTDVHNSKGKNATLHTDKTRAIMLGCHSLHSWPQTAEAVASSSQSTKQILRQYCNLDALHLPRPVCPICLNYSLRRKCSERAWHVTRENIWKKKKKTSIFCSPGSGTQQKRAWGVSQLQGQMA